VPAVAEVVLFSLVQSPEIRDGKKK